MDRFGYCKTIDRALYDKNAETIEEEYKYVLPIWNTDKVCVFTSEGNMHTVKVLDIPAGKIKDKGTPIDNISKFDGTKEEILCVTSYGEMEGESILFVTADSLIKKTIAEEFVTANRTVASTKLADGDKLVCVALITDPDTDVVMISDNDYALRFPLEEVSELKKVSKGEKGMKLGKGERLTGAYLVNDTASVKVRGRDLAINRLKAGHRNAKGSKVRA